MKPRATLVLAMCLAGMIAPGEDVGLLIGVREGNGKLGTVWVMRRGVATIARKVPGAVCAWRDGQLWRFEESSGHVLLRSPSNEVSVVLREEKGESTLSYVGMGLLGVIARGSDFKTFDWPELGKELDYTTALGEQDADNLHKEAGSSQSPWTWTVLRRDGRWWSAYRQLNATADPRPVAALSPLWNTEDGKGVQWSRVSRLYPNAIDLMSDGRQDIAVVVTSEGIVVHRSSGSSLNQRVQRLALSVKSVVSVQWIPGREIGRVAQALDRK